MSTAVTRRKWKDEGNTKIHYTYIEICTNNSAFNPRVNQRNLLKESRYYVSREPGGHEMDIYRGIEPRSREHDNMTQSITNNEHGMRVRSKYPSIFNRGITRRSVVSITPESLSLQRNNSKWSSDSRFCGSQRKASVVANRKLCSCQKWSMIAQAEIHFTDWATSLHHAVFAAVRMVTHPRVHTILWLTRSKAERIKRQSVFSYQQSLYYLLKTMRENRVNMMSLTELVKELTAMTNTLGSMSNPHLWSDITGYMLCSKDSSEHRLFIKRVSWLQSPAQIEHFNAVIPKYSHKQV